MGWSRFLGRESRRRRQPKLESLEGRTLLSTANPATLPAAIPVSASLPVANSTALGNPEPAGGGTQVPAGATDFSRIIGASNARSTYGVDGHGYSVAVIDTGVNYNHEDLGGGLGAGYKVTAGWDFSTNSGDPMPSWQHGTGVAGLIAGSDPASPGVAPGANIVALRVFGSDNSSSFSRVADALQWVVDHHDQYNITVVNLSISDGNNYTANNFGQDGGSGQRITNLIQTLTSKNIAVVAAAGNSFNGSQGVGFTAIVPETISVTASDASDHLVGSAQRLGKAQGGASATDLAAPGAGLFAPVQGNDFATVDGTSFATPLVSGSVVLLQQLYQQRFGSLPTVAQVDSWLQAGADQIHDDATGIDIGRLDVAGAAALVPQATPAPVAPPVVVTPPVVVAPPVVVPPPVSVAPVTPTPPAVVVVTPAPAPVVPTTPVAQVLAPVAPEPAPAPVPAPEVIAAVPAPVAPAAPESTPVAPVAPTDSGVEVSFNGKVLGTVGADAVAGGWSTFLSQFGGSLTSVSAWGNPSATVAAPTSPLALMGQGGKLTRIQAWSNAKAIVGQAQPAGTITPIAPASAANGAKAVPTGPSRFGNTWPNRFSSMAARAQEPGFVGGRSRR